MIRLHKHGLYRLIETKKNTKILYLDNNIFAWVDAKNIGEILVVSHRMHKTDCILSTGKYLIYEVIDEPHLSDQQHLELEAGRGVWQGYLLLSGLPDRYTKRGRIIPTHETITNNRRYEERKESHKILAKA